MARAEKANTQGKCGNGDILNSHDAERTAYARFVYIHERRPSSRRAKCAVEMSDRNADEDCEVGDAQLCANARFDELGDASHLPRCKLRRRDDVVRSDRTKAARQLIRPSEAHPLTVHPTYRPP